MKTEKQQTAVEWYAEQSMRLELERAKGNISINEMFNQLSNVLEKAKEMEKEQIINAREDGFLWGMRNTNNFYADKVIESEQYYNETFKQQEQ